MDKHAADILDSQMAVVCDLLRIHYSSWCRRRAESNVNEYVAYAHHIADSVHTASTLIRRLCVVRFHGSVEDTP